MSASASSSTLGLCDENKLETIIVQLGQQLMTQIVTISSDPGTPKRYTLLKHLSDGRKVYGIYKNQTDFNKEGLAIYIKDDTALDKRRIKFIAKEAEENNKLINQLTEALKRNEEEENSILDNPGDADLSRIGAIRVEHRRISEEMRKIKLRRILSFQIDTSEHTYFIEAGRTVLVEGDIVIGCFRKNNEVKPVNIKMEWQKFELWYNEKIKTTEYKSITSK